MKSDIAKVDVGRRRIEGGWLSLLEGGRGCQPFGRGGGLEEVRVVNILGRGCQALRKVKVERRLFVYPWEGVWIISS